jgi:hypothetical protein
MEPRVSIASDYAVLEAGPFYFYYGYEYDRIDDEEVWGFRVKKNGKVIFEYPHEDEDREVEDCLLLGIGKYLVSLEKKT